MPLNDTSIIIIAILAFGMSAVAIYIVNKLMKKMKEEEKAYNETNAREVKKTFDFFEERKESKEKPKKTLGEVKLEM